MQATQPLNNADDIWTKIDERHSKFLGADAKNAVARDFLVKVENNILEAARLGRTQVLIVLANPETEGIEHVGKDLLLERFLHSKGLTFDLYIKVNQKNTMVKRLGQMKYKKYTVFFPVKTDRTATKPVSITMSSNSVIMQSN